MAELTTRSGEWRCRLGSSVVVALALTVACAASPATVLAQEGEEGAERSFPEWVAPSAGDASRYGLLPATDGLSLVAQATEEAAAESLSPECAAFAEDINADVGEIMRAGCEPTLAQMAKLMDNPLGNVAMLFTQFDYYRLRNPSNDEERDQGVYTGIAQFPKKLTDNWNLINRIVWTVPSVPVDQDKVNDFGSSGGPGSPVLPPGAAPAPSPIDLLEGRTTGFGDMYYVGLFSPASGIKHEGGGTSVWGVGFDLAFPTASEDVLGSGKWSAGPSALYAYLGPKWKLAALLQQYFSYAGDSDRSDVNTMNLQYLYYYSLDDVTSVGAAPNIICDWEQSSDNMCTIPVRARHQPDVQPRQGAGARGPGGLLLGPPARRHRRLGLEPASLRDSGGPIRALQVDAIVRQKDCWSRSCRVRHSAGDRAPRPRREAR